MATKAKKVKKPKATIKLNNVQSFLDKAEMTQQELADRIGSNRAHISKIANQKSPSVSLPIAMKIAEVLGTTVEKLFEMDENKDNV
jgi:DNA-binding XRE family transcriptional regulator